MEILNIALPAGGLVQLRKGGAYFEIISSSYPVNVSFYEGAGGLANTCSNLVAGLYLGCEFSALDINNAGQPAQTIQVLLCDDGESGGSRRAPGVVSIAELIGTTCQTLGGAVNLAANNLSFIQLVAPASNVRGVVLRQATCGGQAGAGSSVEVRILGAPSLPASLLPSPGIILQSQYNPTTGYLERMQGDLRRTLPVGWGLYVGSQVGVAAAAAAAGYSVSFEIL